MKLFGSVPANRRRATLAVGLAAFAVVCVASGLTAMKDYPAEKYFRDVKLCTIGEGTSEIQRLVIARELLGH